MAAVGQGISCYVPGPVMRARVRWLLHTLIPQSLLGLQPWLEESGFQGQLKPLGLVHPQPFRDWGGLFLPDPSIGRWAQWRQTAGAEAFSLIGQIHTISTPTALGFLQDLLTDPVQPWDALICSSTAGREVVQGVLDLHEQQLLERLGVDKTAVSLPRPQLPVIPLPLPNEAFTEPFLLKRPIRPLACLRAAPLCFGSGDCRY